MSLFILRYWNKYQAWFWTQVGAIIMALMLWVEPVLHKPLIVYSGYMATGFLVAVLLLNPLRHFYPTNAFLRKLNLYRRELGVAVFFYTCIHMVCFVIKRGGLIQTLPFLLHPAIGPATLVAFPLLALLTYTSTNKAIKKMGFLKWKKLHKKVYWVEVIVFLHMLLVGEVFYGCLFFLPLFTIQILKRKRARYSQAKVVIVDA